MNYATLFSGIGGPEVAAHWLGWNCVFNCEWNPFGQQVLKHHFPQSQQHNDIKQTDFTIYRGSIGCLIGGFPCQPYSLSGKRLGKEDDRHLWPEMLRAVRELQPTWVVGENVLGIVNWNAGLVFHEVQTDLEAEGYEVQPYVLPASGVGAPHQRYRTFFVAYAHKFTDHGKPRKHARTGGKEGIQERHQVHQFEQSDNVSSGMEQTDFNAKGGRTGRIPNKIEKTGAHEGGKPSGGFCGVSGQSNASNPDCQRYEECQSATESSGEERFDSQEDIEGAAGRWQSFPTQSPVCGRNDGFSGLLDCDTFPEGISEEEFELTFSKWRNETLKAYGNAIVPQVIFPILKAIEAYENLPA